MRSPSASAISRRTSSFFAHHARVGQRDHRGLNAMVSASTRSTAFWSASFIAPESLESGISTAVVTSTTCAGAGVATITDPSTSAPATSERVILKVLTVVQVHDASRGPGLHP